MTSTTAPPGNNGGRWFSASNHTGNRGKDIFKKIAANLLIGFAFALHNIGMANWKSAACLGSALETGAISASSSHTDTLRFKTETLQNV